MGVEQDRAASDAYILQANRRIAKERALAARTAPGNDSHGTPID
jgi:hypothetical protein